MRTINRPWVLKISEKQGVWWNFNDVKLESGSKSTRRQEEGVCCAALPCPWMEGTKLSCSKVTVVRLVNLLKSLLSL